MSAPRVVGADPIVLGRVDPLELLVALRAVRDRTFDPWAIRELDEVIAALEQEER